MGNRLALVTLTLVLATACDFSGGEDPPEEPLEGSVPDGCRSDLAEQDVSGQDFTDQDLSCADLRRTDFTDAILARPDTVGTILDRAWVEGADFTHATLGVQDTDARFGVGISATHLLGCPASLPSTHVCLEMPNDPGETVILGEFVRAVGENLNGLQLEGADLDYAVLDDAILSNSTLTGTSFAFASLRGTRFVEADLTDATLGNADLSGATFIQATAVQDLRWTKAPLAVFDQLHNPSWTNLEKADLTEASLRYARFDRTVTATETTAVGLDARQVEMQQLLVVDSDFTNADFSSSVIGFVEVEDSTFAGANLSGANWSELSYGATASAYFTSVDFTGARLVELDLFGWFFRCDFTDANLLGARIGFYGGNTFSNTTCPDGTNSDDNGGTCTEDL